MMNWRYLCNEESSKETVTDHCQKVWPLHPNLGHFGRPPIGHTIDIYNNDYIINWTYFCVETIIKINRNQQPPKVSSLHVNLGHFGRPPRARWNMPQQLKSSKIIIGHTFSYVKLNFKVGLFSWTFWFEAVFRCKFGILVLVTFTF